MSGPYTLTEGQEMVRAMARQIAKEKLAGKAAEIDRKGEFPWDAIDIYCRNNILGMPIPAEFGGQASDAISCYLVVEEFATVCANSAHALADHWLGLHPLELVGTEEQKKRLLPRLCKELVAFSLTEPAAGSDVASLSTKAIREGDNYVLTGTKCFCTDAAVADHITIFAKTDQAAGIHGISAFFVDRRSHGLSIGKIEDQMGMRGTRACEIVLDGCRVPQENLLGKEGEGFSTAMQTFDRSRPLDAALAVGIAQGALNYAKEYAKQRVQFGKPIAELQGIQFMLADMAIGVESARHLVYRAGSLVDSGSPDSMISAMSKCYASDVAMKVTTDAIQVVGGYGYMRDYPLERMFRDAKLMQIVEGTNQVQRVVIARNLLRR